MTIKQIAEQVIESMPEESTLDDIIHALYVKAKFERGESEIRDGRGIADDDARTRLRKWAG